MRASTAISLAASAAFSLFASAAPIAQVDVSGLLGTVDATVDDVVTVATGVVDGVVSDVDGIVTGLGLRGEILSIPVILTDLTTNLGPVLDELRKYFRKYDLHFISYFNHQASLMQTTQPRL